MTIKSLAVRGVVVAAGLFAGIALWLAMLAAGVLAGPGPELRGDAHAGPGIRVLFVGNSMTYYNDMPALVRELGENDPGAPRVDTVSYTAPGWTLEDFAGNYRLHELLAGRAWDTVVLQEQTGRAAASPAAVRRDTQPYVRDLLADLGAGTRVLLYVPWQATGEHDLAATLALAAPPVGRAWDEAYARDPQADLVDPDGHHPSRAGSYLTACVIYAVLTGRDPAGSTFTAGVRDARFLQGVAGDVVFAGS